MEYGVISENERLFCKKILGWPVLHLFEKEGNWAGKLACAGGFRVGRKTETEKRSKGEIPTTLN